MKELILYHNVVPDFPCPDGIASAWVAAKKYPNADVLGCTYNQRLDPQITSQFFDYDFVLVVDFSLPEDLIEALQAKNIKIRIIDHHEAFLKTVEENLLTGSLENRLKQLNIVYDINECGATLTWKTLFPNDEMPAFLHYIRDRDLFYKKLPNTNEVHMAMAALQRTFSLFDSIQYMDELELLAFLVPIGTPRWEKRCQTVNSLVEKGYKDKHTYFIKLNSNTMYLRADVAEKILLDHPGVKIVVITGGDRIRIKCRHGINLLSIFHDFPRLGGHPSSINFDPFDDWMTTLMNYPDLLR